MYLTVLTKNVTQSMVWLFRKYVQRSRHTTNMTLSPYLMLISGSFQCQRKCKLNMNVVLKLTSIALPLLVWYFIQILSIVETFSFLFLELNLRIFSTQFFLMLQFPHPSHSPILVYSVLISSWWFCFSPCNILNFWYRPPLLFVTTQPSPHLLCLEFKRVKLEWSYKSQLRLITDDVFLFIFLPTFGFW